MIKAISYQHLNALGDVWLSSGMLWDSLEPCYTKKQIEQVLENVKTKTKGNYNFLIDIIKQELEKLDGE